MGRSDQLRLVRYCLMGGAVLAIGIGLFIVSTESAIGWIAVAFGVIDLATIPFVMRLIGSRNQSDNPYARED